MQPTLSECVDIATCSLCADVMFICRARIYSIGSCFLMMQRKIERHSQIGSVACACYAALFLSSSCSTLVPIPILGILINQLCGCECFGRKYMGSIRPNTRSTHLN